MKEIATTTIILKRVQESCLPFGWQKLNFRHPCGVFQNCLIVGEIFKRTQLRSKYDFIEVNGKTPVDYNCCSLILTAEVGRIKVE